MSHYGHIRPFHSNPVEKNKQVIYQPRSVRIYLSISIYLSIYLSIYIYIYIYMLIYVCVCVKQINSIFGLSFYHYLVSYNTTGVLHSSDKMTEYIYISIFIWLCKLICCASFLDRIGALKHETKPYHLVVVFPLSARRFFPLVLRHLLCLHPFLFQRLGDFLCHQIFSLLLGF